MPLMLPSSSSVPPSPFSFVLSKMDIVRYCIGTFRTVQQLEKKKKITKFQSQSYLIYLLRYEIILLFFISR